MTLNRCYRGLKLLVQGIPCLRGAYALNHLSFFFFYNHPPPPDPSPLPPPPPLPTPPPASAGAPRFSVPRCVVITPHASRAAKCSISARPSDAPSSGSVPAPSSSHSSRLVGDARSAIS